MVSDSGKEAEYYARITGEYATIAQSYKNIAEFYLRIADLNWEKG